MRIFRIKSDNNSLILFNEFSTKSFYLRFKRGYFFKKLLINVQILHMFLFGLIETKVKLSARYPS
jgi:hypothetical protein